MTAKKLFVLLAAIAVFCAINSVDCIKKKPTKKRPSRFQQKGPYFAHQHQHRIARNTDSKEVDGRKPIGEDLTIPQLIYLGTKWCGQGNIATHYGDLGVYGETDKCCRNHDYCKDYIPSGETKYGLTNQGAYIKVHCDCDMEFRQCLMDDDSEPSQKIGYIYFNALGGGCFKMDYPIIQCKNYTAVHYRCLEYEQDEAQEKKWQFFDIPLYD